MDTFEIARIIGEAFGDPHFPARVAQAERAAARRNNSNSARTGA